MSTHVPEFQSFSASLHHFVLVKLATSSSRVKVTEYQPDKGNIATVQTFNSCTSRPDVCQCLVVQIPMDNMSENKPSVARKSKLHSIVRSSMQSCPGDLVAFGRAVVHHAWAAQAFSAGIKSRHCNLKCLNFS